jgi:hypothetical protein
MVSKYGPEPEQPFERTLSQAFEFWNCARGLSAAGLAGSLVRDTVKQAA